jgi:hypothetical protein
MSNRLFSDPDKLADSLFEKSDRHFTTVEKTIKRGFIVVAIMWVFGTLISLSFFGAVVWVAWHFISKYW